VELALDPTAGHPLGIKGGGEGGIMPATPMRVWSAIANAKTAK
jgi:CO/xanthine dehydrogenase Mo-binding subunit